MDVQTDEAVSFVTLYARIVSELACNPRIAQETLARKLDVTMRTVQRHMTELEREGYLTVDRRQKPFTYTVQWDRALPYFASLRVSLFRPTA